MAGINIKRVVIAGLAAGAVMIVGDIVIYGFMFPSLWEGAISRLNMSPAGTDADSGGLITFAIEFGFGLLLAYLYAAIRPRFGPGWGTALRAGVALWLATVLVYSGLATFGILQWALIGQVAMISWVLALLGATTAGYLYQEA